RGAISVVYFASAIGKANMIGMKSRLMVTLGVEFCFALLASTFLAGMIQPMAVPGLSGKQAVGTFWIRIVDPSRTDPYLRNGSKRELLVRFWYPRLGSGPCKAAPYTSPKVWNYLSQLIGVQLPEVRTNSCENARVTPGLHPVIIASPGYTGMLTDYTFLFEDLASRGY